MGLLALQINNTIFIYNQYNSYKCEYTNILYSTHVYINVQEDITFYKFNFRINYIVDYAISGFNFDILVAVFWDLVHIRKCIIIIYT